MDPDPDQLASALAALRELMLASERYRHVAADQLGMGVSDSQAVSYLYSRGDIGQTELGRLLSCNTSSITALVDRLERSGTVRRVPDPHDRRRTKVSLTEQGLELIQTTFDYFGGAFDHVDPAELSVATRLLATIATGLRDNAGLLAAANAPAPANA